MSTGWQHQTNLRMAPQVSFLDENALPVSIASVRNRLSLNAGIQDDMLCEMILEITDKLETEVESYLRPAEVVEYYDHMFGYNVMVGNVYLGYGYWPFRWPLPWDLSLKKWPVLEVVQADPSPIPVPPTMEYLPAAGGGYQAFTDFQLALESIPSKLRMTSDLPDVAEDPKAWRIKYTSFYEKVPMIAKRAIIQKVVDEYEHRGLNTGETDVLWQKAVAQLTWGPLA